MGYNAYVYPQFLEMGMVLYRLSLNSYHICEKFGHYILAT